MTINFDFDNVTLTEFGLGLDQDQRSYVQVPVDGDVQDTLLEMAQETYRLMTGKTTTPETYQPSEKYAGTEYLTLALSDDMVVSIKGLHDAANIEEDASALDAADDCFAYYAQFTDSQNRKLTAVRRASQFKGVLKKRLISFGDNTLKIIPDKVFKLDNDFDFLVDSVQLHILRPNGLEFTAQLQEAIMAAVQGNVATISSEITYVNFESISMYAQRHPRAARYIASIRSQSEAHNVDKDKLKSLCQRTEVNFTENNNLLEIDDANVMGFLEVLDRRRYEVDLVEDSIEVFRASGRSQITQGGE
ncbi:MAG: DUF4868 domain-containing protein [Candidatus Thiodiazotropha sp. (ex Lucinoma kastoroae)]|nr:DUF4868 domain-containing protein [Candidatus Thiodiazotropha sp. (ex Lucinoma kastoroae)]